MPAKKAAKTRRKLLVLIPDSRIREAARRKLPIFPPYDTRGLLADAQRSLAGRSLDEAVIDAYNQRCRSQFVQLLRALGGDPNDANFWQNAFLKLARIHHNLGGLVHRQRSTPANATAWTAKDEYILLCGVYALTQQGKTEREAIRSIADAGVFPHHERQPSQRLSGHATRVPGRDWRTSDDARRDALWRKYQRLRSNSRGMDSLARPFGIGLSNYETWLTELDSPSPLPRSSGDTGARRKGRIRKSPEV
jgi:hypothetical protein